MSPLGNIILVSVDYKQCMVALGSGPVRVFPASSCQWKSCRKMEGRSLPSCNTPIELTPFLMILYKGCCAGNYRLWPIVTLFNYAINNMKASNHWRCCPCSWMFPSHAVSIGRGWNQSILRVHSNLETPTYLWYARTVNTFWQVWKADVSGFTKFRSACINTNSLSSFLQGSFHMQAEVSFGPLNSFSAS